MSEAITLISRRISEARAHRRTARADRSVAASSTPRTSFGETFAIGLGCDSWKPRAH
jgi:hypothetical protein